jgi:hypothetical protein
MHAAVTGRTTAGKGHAGMSTYIFFFGGYKASINDVMKWQGSAASQTADDVYVFTYAWPAAASSDSTGAVAGFKSAHTFDKAVSDINACSKDLVYIVGHSSGCAIANAVDNAVKDHDKVKLIVLDGFLPDRAQLARASTQVWSAEGSRGVARNHDRLKKAIGGQLNIYKSSSCTTRMALHFSVVNAAATDASVPDIPSGYSNCRANLVWM